MKQSRHIQVALLASLLSVLLCAITLAGTSFAWFSDAVFNGGNTLQTGAVMATFTIGNDETIRNGQTVALQTASWEPGTEQTVTFQVTPQPGTLPYTYSIWLKTDSPIPALADYLKLYNGPDSSSDTLLGTVAQLVNGPVVTGPGEDNNSPAKVSLTLRLQDDAPLSVAGQNMNLWFEVRADQPREDVTTAENLQAQLSAGGLVTLEGDITLDTAAQAEGPLLRVTKDTVLDLGDHTLSAPLQAGQVLLEVEDGAILTLKGSTTERGTPAKWGLDTGTDGVAIRVDGGSRVYIEGGNYQGTENATILRVENGYAEIDGGSFRVGENPFVIGSDDGQYEIKKAAIASAGSWSIGG